MSTSISSSDTPAHGAHELQGVRVLLMENHSVVREVISRLLETFGAKVIAVPGVPEALEALGRERPNVVLSSIATPGEGGYALIRKVRALPPDRGGQTPAAALTGLSTAEDRARALRAGFQFHVAKPVDARRLVAVVATMAAQSWNRASLEGTRQGGSGHGKEQEGVISGHRTQPGIGGG
jgi:CheY-like chemotaxis protein